MATSQDRFRCPACGFAIFNRRIQQCESCKAALPPNLLFNAEDLSRLQAEAEQVEKIRLALTHEAAEEELKRQKRRGDGG